MLELESEDQKQFDAGDLVWYKSQESLESSGWCVFDLKLSNKKDNTSNLNEILYDGEGFFTFEFAKE